MKLKQKLNFILDSGKLFMASRLENPMAFLFIGTGTVLSILVTIIFFDALYAHKNSIAGWSKPEVLILIGTTYFINAVSWTTYRKGLSRLMRFVLNGKLDLYLMKPVSLRFIFNFHWIDFIFSVPQYITSILIIIYGIHSYGDNFYLGQYLFLVFCGISLTSSITFIVESIHFFSPMASSFALTNTLFSMGNYPIDIYTGKVKWFLTFIFPVAFIFSVPSQALFGKISLETLSLSVFISLLFYLLSLFVWSYGVKHYESAQG